jgi:rod shape-determining protein MreD
MRLIFLLMTFGGSLAQSSLVPMLSVAGVTPDLPLILTVLLALRRGPESGCLAGFVVGILQDVAGGGLVGVQAVTKALAGFAVGMQVGRLWVTNPLVQVPGLVLLTIAEGVARVLLLQLFHYPASLGDLMAHVILPQAFYNGFVGAACMLAMSTADALRRGRPWI